MLMNLGEFLVELQMRLPIDSVDGKGTVSNLNAGTPPERFNMKPPQKKTTGFGR